MVTHAYDFESSEIRKLLPNFIKETPSNFWECSVGGEINTRKDYFWMPLNAKPQNVIKFLNLVNHIRFSCISNLTSIKKIQLWKLYTGTSDES